MRTLIFGCGYLGQRVAASWLRAGHRVAALTRSSQHAAAFQQNGIQPLIGDVCDVKSLSDLPEVDAILYAVGFDRTGKRSHEEVTSGGLQNVLQAASNRCRRFIFVSSTSVYGQSNGEWVDEDSPCEPNQPGGKLNLIAEGLVRDRFRANQDRTANILRLAGIYGPGRLLSRIDALRSAIPLAGRGDAWLNLIHVDDAVTAVDACLNQYSVAQTYNVVDNLPIERRTYFELLANLVGAPCPAFDPAQAALRGSGGINKRCANRRLTEDFAWSPQYSSIATGLPASVGDSAN